MAKQNRSKLSLFQRFGLFFYDRAKTTSSLWIVVVLFGFLSYGVFMQRQGFPNIAVPISITSGTYFVDNKEKVDADLVKPMSELIMKRSDVKTVTANAGANFFSVVTEYKDGTDAKKAQSEVEAAAKAAGFVPDNASVAYEDINVSKYLNEYDVLLSVRQGESTSTEDLIKLAEQAVKDLNGTVGVESFKVVSPFKTGISPATGESVTLQQTFDRVGTRENGKTTFYPSVEIGVKAKSGTDAIHLERAINEKLDAINNQASYKGARIAVSAGVAESIETQISDLQTNLIEGLVVVIIISLLLISWRAGLATALSMASVLLITVGVLFAVGITLNTITLFALVLCLGLIVDDTTIMAEAIDAGKKAGTTNREIVATAMKKVARASTAGTLVTMLAFAPMLFIGGILGSFIRVLPITIIVSLAVSLLVSLTLIPFMSRFLLLNKSSKNAGKTRNPVLRLENSISSGLANLIRVGNRSRKKAAGIGIVALLISFLFLMGSSVFFQKLKFDIFPSTKDTDSLAITLTFPSNSTITANEKITADADQILSKSLGENMLDVSYWDSGDAHTAMGVIRLTSFKERDIKAPELVSNLTTAFKDFTEARVKVASLDTGPPKDDLPFRVQIYGENTAKTDKLAKAIASYLDGQTVTRTSNKKTAKVTRVEIVGDTDTVTRNNAKRMVEVRAGFDADDVSALVTAAQKTVQDKFTDAKIASYGVKSSDVAFDFGEESNNQDSFKSMLVAFPVLLIIMFLLLAFQFRSLLQPLLIFTAIPFSFFGVAAGLHATNNPLSFFVMIGFFALIGIAVNNTILLTDFANQAHKEGNGAFESMALAVKARFRPLIATSLTSVLALIPLALSDPFWEGLAFTLIFGLLSSTFLVVVSFPYFYLAAEFLRRRYSRRLTIAWIIVIIGGMYAAISLHSDSKHKLAYVPYVFLGAAVIMLTTYIKGKFANRLSRR
jgi:HAE1 family hydrophobic/amphiphilic exporter-1